MKSLGELVYKELFHMKIIHKNDGNGHLNNSYYPFYSEETRQKFLKSFGWSDEKFREEGIAMVMRTREISYKRSLTKGDNIKIDLKIFFKKDPFFYMVYTFYDPSEQIAAIDKTKALFVSSSENTGAVKVPKFFLEKIKNY